MSCLQQFRPFRLRLAFASSRVRRATSTRGLASDGASKKEAAVKLVMQETKVSPSGSADSMLQELMDGVRQRRAMLGGSAQERAQMGDVGFRQPVWEDTDAIKKLKQDEIELTRKIFARVDPRSDAVSNLQGAAARHNIDPYWSPFHQVEDLKQQVTAEFDEYQRIVGAAEAKRTRIQIKRSLARMSRGVYNPYSSSFRIHQRQEVPDQPPKPFRLPDKFWEPSPLQVQLANERITFRDLDIIQHFLADNGYILPRRTTMLSRRKQKELVKAVISAQHMCLLPFRMKPKDYQVMPLMDPLQWMADRLTDRVREDKDRRSAAMLQVMMERYPELNYRNFLKHEAARKEGEPDMPCHFTNKHVLRVHLSVLWDKWEIGHRRILANLGRKEVFLEIIFFYVQFFVR